MNFFLSRNFATIAILLISNNGFWFNNNHGVGVSVVDAASKFLYPEEVEAANASEDESRRGRLRELKPKSFKAGILLPKSASAKSFKAGIMPVLPKSIKAPKSFKVKSIKAPKSFKVKSLKVKSLKVKSIKAPKSSKSGKSATATPSAQVIVPPTASAYPSFSSYPSEEPTVSAYPSMAKSAKTKSSKKSRRLYAGEEEEEEEEETRSPTVSPTESYQPTANAKKEWIERARVARAKFLREEKAIDQLDE